MLQSLIDTNTALILLALAVVTVLNLFLVLILLGSNGRLKRRFKKWKAIHTSADLDEVYETTLKEVERFRKEIQGIHQEVESLRNDMKRKVSTAKMLRYNAFSDQGSDLSYSVAFLDEHRDGVVLSSIYGRQETRTYGKPVQAGASTYPLTDEEEEVLAMATGQPSREKVHS